MTVFTSKRERRLWLWTLVVVTAIYATLGMAQTVAGALDDFWLGAGFWTGLVLVGLAVAVTGLKTRPRGLQIGVALGIAGVYLIAFLRTAIPAERSHIIEYSVVALLIHEALKERASQGRRVPVPTLIAIAATTLVGLLDEGIQILIPGRVFDTFDILFNFLAALMAVAGSVALAWARRRHGR